MIGATQTFRKLYFWVISLQFIFCSTINNVSISFYIFRQSMSTTVFPIKNSLFFIFWYRTNRRNFRKKCWIIGKAFVN